MLAFAYPWLKWLHIVAVVSWMVGLFYLPRLFVYHSETASDEVRATLETMEERLMRVIMTPAMFVTWVSGLLVGASLGAFGQPWLWIKIMCVVALTGFHGLCGRWRRDLVAGSSTRTSGFFRTVNEVPTVLLIVIVGLVVIKPFG